MREHGSKLDMRIVGAVEKRPADRRLAAGMILCDPETG